MKLQISGAEHGGGAGQPHARRRALGCTQSAVSHSLDTLERELGFPLLKRGRAGVTLTDEGERLLPAVRELLRSRERLDQTGRLDPGSGQRHRAHRGLHLRRRALAARRAQGVSGRLPARGVQAPQRGLPRRGKLALRRQHRHRLCERPLRGGLRVHPADGGSAAGDPAGGQPLRPATPSSRSSSARPSPSSACWRAPTTTRGARWRPRASSPTSASTPRTTTPSWPWWSRAWA